MAAKWIETFTGSLEQKKQYKLSSARLKALPRPYAETAAALQRYFLYQGGVTDGQILVDMLSDLADLLEAAAAEQTPIRDIVSDDPVEFAEDFTKAYGGERWIDKERNRLIESINRAESESERQEP
ncbi:hypothetical protein AUR04nite_23820 [Glutamicibacter uratoxydans]|uniref:DUF1048 domain-containing protein n=1 Tax=Glutamicibacter uratoxydans TaxID=43667 RepID=A0A4Y4DTQ3_GLUUR|nr:DUF1048 domain-containing protein [Glutamicibacter uratoxydans]GED06850.1 hypothetical protein AUR04nite_23820 [Glutamicibacter uratoxydans]